MGGSGKRYGMSGIGGKHRHKFQEHEDWGEAYGRPFKVECKTCKASCSTVLLLLRSLLQVFFHFLLLLLRFLLETGATGETTRAGAKIAQT